MSVGRCQGSWMPTAMGLESGWCENCGRQVQASGLVDGANRLMPHNAFGTVISESMPGSTPSAGGDVTAAQRDLLTLVEAMKAASAVTQTAVLNAEDDAFLRDLGESLAHQIHSAVAIAKAMERYAASHDQAEMEGT